jgi:4-hydroxybenzoate polyprenyltransferase
LIFTFYAVRSVFNLYLVPLNLAAILLLWFYSVRFKKSFLVGNILISLLVAWTIIIFFLSKINPLDLVKGEEIRQARFYQLCSLYAGFAFLSTMARELIKDIEDREGDRRHGCKTLPIVWGIPVARFVALLWLFLLLILLLVVMVYLLQFKMRIAFVYAFLFLVAPLILLIRKTTQANKEEDFSLLSNRMKWFLLAGIFSMIFFYF